MSDDFMKNIFVHDQHFVKTMTEKYGENFFAELGKGQHPPILWIGCSDSRVSASDILELEPVWFRRIRPDLSLFSRARFSSTETLLTASLTMI